MVMTSRGGGLEVMCCRVPVGSPSAVVHTLFTPVCPRMSSKSRPHALVFTTRERRKSGSDYISLLVNLLGNCT